MPTPEEESKCSVELLRTNESANSNAKDFRVWKPPIKLYISRFLWRLSGLELTLQKFMGFIGENSFAPESK